MSSGAPCGACKFLRRKCLRGCVFAPYFGAEQGAAKFAAVHKIFGASNVAKLLLHIPLPRRSDAVLTISYEAQARLADPVYGCVATIFALQQQVASLQAELAMVQSANRQAAAAAALVHQHHQHHHQHLQQQQLLQQTAGAGPQIQLSPSAAGMMQLAGQLQHEAKAGAAHELMSPAINLCNISIMSGSSAAHGNTYANPRVKEENNSAMQQARQYVDNCNMGMSINPASSSHRLPDHSNLHKFRRIRHDDEPINLMNPTVLVHELHHRQQTSSHDDQAGAGSTGGDHLSQTLASILPRK